ncbi:MAG: peptide-methionine (S)-S-oxide reductase MsrA [Thermoleophilaceae bacterium]
MLQFLTGRKTNMPAPDDALAGRDTAIVEPGNHAVLGTPMALPFPEDTEHVILGMGCFWGAERVFWELDGMYTTAVGYGAGYTPNPTYDEVCSGRTGHNEVVLAVFRPEEVAFDDVLRAFWEGHNPTQGMRQGNDVGTQYRSGVYTTTEAQQEAALQSKERYADALEKAGKRGEITTEVLSAGEFYYAEEYHQQYLSKNPGGYCGLGGTGVACPIGTGVAQAS